MKSIFFTYDAIQEIVSNRFLQSGDYEDAHRLCSLLKGETPQMLISPLRYQEGKSSTIIYTPQVNSNKNRGVLLDKEGMADLFALKDNDIITVLQKTLKYSVRYFERQPRVDCEKELPNSISIVYPFPYAATANVEKMVLDRNSSKHSSRLGKDILTAFYFGCDDKHTFEDAALNRMLKDLDQVSFRPTDGDTLMESQDSPIGVTYLQQLPISIDSELGIDNWLTFLTQPQSDFVKAPIDGKPIRLEGAAGTGKTLSLVLRSIYVLKEKIKEMSPYHIIFLTHSLPTKERIEEIFRNNWEEYESHKETPDNHPQQSILVTTLQEWSSLHLGVNAISEEEFLNKDASEAKLIQRQYILQAYHRVKTSKKAFESICSRGFMTFLDETSDDVMVEMLQQEISEIIKGRAKNKLDVYLNLNRPQNSLPLETAEDRKLVYEIFGGYQKDLESQGKFDSDDIVITALGQVETPIWARRRQAAGYDMCIIDETHLFNLNDLSMFHHLTKPDSHNNIVFAIDQSQAITEKIDSWKELMALEPNLSAEKGINYSTIFRCSPAISNLAFTVLSSGASLFTTLVNPMTNVVSNFTSSDEKKCKDPVYIECTTEEEMIEMAFKEASDRVKATDGKRHKTAIFGTNEELVDKILRWGTSYHKPIQKLLSRSDANSMKKAKNDGKFVVSLIDYVGGLEFDNIIIVGVDHDRVPPKETSGLAAHYLTYLWYNKMYVAITRAQYSVTLIGERTPGPSPIIEHALRKGLILTSA